MAKTDSINMHTCRHAYLHIYVYVYKKNVYSLYMHVYVYDPFIYADRLLSS